MLLLLRTTQNMHTLWNTQMSLLKYILYVHVLFPLQRKATLTFRTHLSSWFEYEMSNLHTLLCRITVALYNNAYRSRTASLQNKTLKFQVTTFFLCTCFVHSQHLSAAQVRNLAKLKCFCHLLGSSKCVVSGLAGSKPCTAPAATLLLD